MQVTNEIRHAFLVAAMNLESPEINATINKLTIQTHVRNAFEAEDTKELFPWLTDGEKRIFSQKLSSLIGGGEWCVCRQYLAGTPHTCEARTLETDLTEDR